MALCAGSDREMILQVRQVTSSRDPVATPDALVDLANRAFTNAEEGLVRPDANGQVVRLTLQSTREQLDRGEFLILTGRHASSTKPPVLLGCCTVVKLEDAATGEWGCLAVEPAYQKRGYGQRLALAAEYHLSDLYGCRTLQIKLLGFAKPVQEANNPAYEHKERLIQWYTQKLAYKTVPHEALYFAANSSWGNVQDTIFESDAVLLPFRKFATTWIELATTTDESHMGQLVEFCNNVYQEGESGILQHTPENPIIRLLVPDAMELIQKQQLLVLWEKTSNDDNNDNNKQPIGCIKAEIVKQKMGEWGCLAVHPKYQHKGYARRLVQAAEYHLQHKYGCTQLQLQLLTPVDWTQTHKERLRGWYQDRLDYQPLESCRDYKAKGDTLGPLVFATDAVFTTYAKSVGDKLQTANGR
eukprot:scaffold3526_cov153-Amphora_coffeaeformis.AAC.2